MYTDPGLGLFLVQLILAAVLTAAYRFRRLFTGLSTARRRGRSKVSKPPYATGFKSSMPTT
jgi:hypothetical protein